MLGQHWQMAQAAEPKQLKRDVLSECISVCSVIFVLLFCISACSVIFVYYFDFLAYHAAVLPREMMAPIVDHQVSLFPQL